MSGGSKPVGGGARSAPSQQTKSKEAKPSEKTSPSSSPKGSEAKDARAKDSFEAARPKPKVDLNPSAPPANTNAESKAKADPDAGRREQVNAELARTETGRQAQRDLERSGAKVDFEDGDKSYFDPEKNRVVIGRGQSAADASASLVNESVHAAAYANGTSPDPAKMSKAEYVEAMTREEAKSSALEIEHRRELAAQGRPPGTNTTALDGEYDGAYRSAIANGQPADAAKEAGRAAVLQGVQNGDAVAGLNGQRYGDYYADQYDRVASGEISAAQVRRSDDRPEPMQHPEKMGLVINRPLSALPSKADLVKMGASGVRMSITAKMLEEPGALDNLEKALKAYHDTSDGRPAIKVTLNLPPELVHGKPEFTRGGKLDEYDPETLKDGQILHQNGPLSEQVDEKAWTDYQDAYVKQAKTIAEKCGPNVDNWEVGNEPDATERTFVAGKRPPGDPVTITPEDEKGHSGVEYNDSLDPGFPPGRYATLLNTTYDALKTVNPNAKVFTAGLVAGDAEWGADSYLKRAEATLPADQHLKFDGIAVHPYAKFDATSFTGLVDSYEALGRSLRGHEGQDIPIVITEASPGQVSDDELANYIKMAGPASDGDANLQSVYFFYEETFDHHPGLKESKKSRQVYRDLVTPRPPPPPAP